VALQGDNEAVKQSKLYTLAVVGCQCALEPDRREEDEPEKSSQFYWREVTFKLRYRP
jgi:hypothetical protein